MKRHWKLIAITLFTMLPALRAGTQDEAIYLLNFRCEQKGITPPSALSLPFPTYPSEALRAGIAGYVSVRFLVHDNGRVSGAQTVASSARILAPAAVSSVSSWRFSPWRGGQAFMPAAIWMRCDIVFKLDVEDDGLPTFFPAFAHTTLSGREVLRLAMGALRKAHIAYQDYSGFEYPMISVSAKLNGTIYWCVEWSSKDHPGEGLRVWIDDATKSASIEKVPPARVRGTPSQRIGALK